MPPAASSRSDLLDDLMARLSGRGPRVNLLSGPRGWGKREILETVSRRLTTAGIHPIEIDLSLSAIHPGEFACAVAAACFETALGASHEREESPAGGTPPEARLRALAGSGALDRLGSAAGTADAILAGLEARGGRAEELVEAALELPARIAEEAGGQVVVLFHALDHLSRLAPYPGLRGIEFTLSRALRPGGVRVAASISPEGRPLSLLKALEERLEDELRVEPIPPLGAAELRALGCDDPVLLGVTGGRLLTTRILAARMDRGLGLEPALLREMDAGEGRLYHELRFDYHLLIERTRGHAACRSVLNVLAREEGLDLSGVAARLRRTPGSTLDYLRWLTEVGLVTREGRRYRFRDPLLKLFVLLYQVPEASRDASERPAVIRSFVSGLESPPRPLRPVGRPRGATSERGPVRRPAAAERARRSPGPTPREKDDLIEID